MVDVVTNKNIRAPLERVADYTANPDNAPEWYVNIQSAEWKTKKPLSVGSQIAFKAQFLGRELAYVYEIVEYIAGEKMIMRTAQGPFPMETTYTWEAVDENTTQMTLRNRGNPTGFSKLVAPIMSAMMRKANMKDLDKLKNILEKN
ncbi:SRPBCC family protein [Cytobacillus oceanisediminis]|uniref:Polyketide cyclase/dehydrase/lipid transport protein n=1 Tax=Cytobacillus oceanisediminis TaxID=665099 RepID=A0A562K5C6_9BACI|nr:SRPBCC family protein [Cytobacillus oceanisediminis]TWH90632.1 polyketide cyclase/dehydrase/lipid transport protein [Cytobacillus oceanisediminis]